MQSINFIIYEQSFLIRKGLVAIIDKIPNSKILLKADNEEELLEGIPHKEADILIINESFFEKKENIKQFNQLRNLYTICLSLKADCKINEVHIDAYININEGQKSILKKINKIISDNLSKNNIEKIPEEISKREADILKYIALGYSNKEIADKLFLSTHTVVTHRKNITRKLGIKTVPGLTIYAIINKIIDINDKEQLNPNAHK